MSGAFTKAAELLFHGDHEVYFVTWTSLRFALTSIAIAALIGVPVGAAIGLHQFRGKRLVTSLLSSLMALPTVLVGLAVYTLISRQGPLGSLSILFTPQAIILGQAILAFPIVASLVAFGTAALDPRLFEVLKTLGASRSRTLWMTLAEARNTVLGAVLTAFGRVVGEVGIAMMLGGNIRWYTRTHRHLTRNQQGRVRDRFGTRHDFAGSRFGG
jgi:tungstate transport system permease protein